MDADRFDALTRLLTASGSRRTLARFAAGLSVALVGAGSVEAGRCGPCERKTRRGCKPRKDNTICSTSGCCRNGRCRFPPNCAGAGALCTSNPNGCCSGDVGCSAGTCVPGGKGSRCFGDQDCAGGRICVGYSCR